MLNRFPSDKINFTKKHTLFSFSYSFTFNSLFLYELKHMVCVEFSIFNSVSFLSKFIFLFNKKHGLKKLFNFKTL